MTEELFVSVIENMRMQIAQDKKNSHLIAEAFSCDTFFMYDISKLIKAIMDLMHLHFPPSKEGHCEIMFYCFVLDFGKLGLESEPETPQMLYQRLTKK